MLIWGSQFLLILAVGFGAIAFVTLLERKVLGLSQMRLGPNKVSISGLLQPVSDGVKLLSKDSFRPLTSQEMIFMLSPSLLLLVFMFSWGVVLPWSGRLFLLKNSALILFCTLASMAYSVILAGWSTTSAFSKLGGMRGILQSLSFEVALILAFLWGLIELNKFSFASDKIISLEFAWGWIVLLLIIALTEGNRAPFDLLEGESEIISGFNIEMGSLMFVLLFLSEYGMILLMMAVFTQMVMAELYSLAFLILVMLMLILRSCFPRVRYDSLMGLMWKSILPVVTLILVWCFTCK